MLTPTQQSEFASKLASWQEGCTKIIAEYWTRNNFTHSPHEVLSTSEGPKFIKVWAHDRQWLDQNDHSKGPAPVGRPNRIYAFINKETGDVLKPNSTRAPHPKPRGNLFDAHNGLKYMNNHGPMYLK